MLRFAGLFATLFAVATLWAAPVAAATSVKTERITVTPNGDHATPDVDSAKDSDADKAGDSPEGAVPAEALPSQAEQATTVQTDVTELPEVHYGEKDLPEPVRRMRQAILEAARSGDPEALRPVLESNEMMPTLSFGEIGDPIDFLKQSSGDGKGQELLAIMTEILESGWVLVDKGTPQEKYVWPYFAAYPLDKLTPPQMVELYRIVTAADVDEMRNYGTYIFYRFGIGPDGTWHFFVAGD